MIIWGQRLYGRLLLVPGVFYIATQFFHIWYIPLFPIQSWIVFEGSESSQGKGTSWRGHKIPMSFKSVLFGWLRAGAIVGGISGALFGFIQINDHDGDGWKLIGLAVVAAGVFIASKWLGKASPESARALISKSYLAADAKEQLIALCGKAPDQLQDLPEVAP